MPDWTEELQVFCADIGSIARGSFAWARRVPNEADEEVHAPASIESLARALIHDFANERPVALGLEMPLFIPVPARAEELGKARPCDLNAPAWSSSVGSSVMATGIAQLAWILRSVRDHSDADVHLRWESFVAAQQGLLIWEAFVTRDAKGATHEEDAKIGVDAFCAQLPMPGDADANDVEQPFSVAAAAVAWAGWQVPLEELRSTCVLVRA